MFKEDTIVAISTPPGEGGIGIVRMSGPTAESIIRKIFVLKNNKPIGNIEDRYFYYGKIIDRSGETIDEVMMVMMKNPRSYTKEDVVEVHCHGGIFPVKRILSLIVEMGARISEPGEFTKRAFLNGRIDLAQAEAVMDLISAKSHEAAKASVRQMEGNISQKIEALREKLLDVLAHIEVTIDYPEEDIEARAMEALKKTLGSASGEIDELLNTADQGRLIRNGIKTVIIGKPNVGKSSLLNALVKENRAIVTDIPGTTRDVIEEYINIKGILVRILDTAGIRETIDMIEKIGVERSKKNINDADLIILVLDASEPLENEDRMILDWIDDKETLIILNKTDKPIKIDIDKLSPTIRNKTIIHTSIIEGKGIDKIEEYIYKKVYSGGLMKREDLIITNMRHQESLREAKNHLHDALNAIENGTPVDLVSIDIRGAWEALGFITGETLTENLIDKIFSEFCLGK